MIELQGLHGPGGAGGAGSAGSPAALRGRLRQTQSRLGDFGRLHRGVGVTLGAWVDRNFETQGALLRGPGPGAGPGAGAWPALSAATLAARRRRGQGSRPLQATGRLRKSIVVRSSRTAVQIGTPLPYARRHQYGIGVPRRAIFPGRERAAHIVMPLAARHVATSLR